MADIIDGRALAVELKSDVQRKVKALERASGRTPGLAVVLVGSDPASEVYVRRKVEDCKEVGIQSIEHRLASSTTETELLDLIDELNSSSHVDGILVQLPLPDVIDASNILNRIAPNKDVDGFHPVNVGRLSTGTNGLVPCTPLGVIKLLETMIDDFRGIDIVVIGKSNIVGKPVALLLLEREATVTVTHVETKNLSDITRRADVIIAAAGAPHLVKGYWAKPGAIIIDVGITRVTDEETGKTKLVGDCAHKELEHAKAITPVPGGVGPMTIACLLSNTVRAFCLANNINESQLG